RVQDERAARLATDGEREHEESLALELADRDRPEAAVSEAPEAGGREGRVHQASKRQPGGLLERVPRPAEPLALGREAGEAERARGSVERDGAGLERELLHERLGDLLRALRGPVPVGHDLEEELDRREVDQRVVALLLDGRERRAQTLRAIARPPASPVEPSERRVVAQPAD